MRYILIILLLCSICFGADVFVSHSGTDESTADGSVSLPFKTINKAIHEMGAGDTVKITNDSTYTFASEDPTAESLVGVYVPASNTFFPASASGWTTDEFNGFYAHFDLSTAVIGSSDYGGYLIDDTDDTSNGNIVFSDATMSGREFGSSASLELVAITTDQSKIFLSNTGGDTDTGVWQTVTSADATDQATLNIDGLAAPEGSANDEAISWDEDMYILSDLIITAGISNTQNVYLIQDQDGSDSEGLRIERCSFPFVKGVLHLASAGTSANTTVRDCTMSLSAFTGHTAFVTVGGGDGHVIDGNFMDRRNVNITFQGFSAFIATAGSNTGSRGITIVNNVMANGTHNRASDALNHITGINFSGGKIGLCANNTFYNIGTSDPDNSENGAFYSAGVGVEQTNIDLCYNNIIDTCDNGFWLEDGANNDPTINYNDFNCLSNIANSAYDGPGSGFVSAGDNDILLDPRFVNPDSGDFRLRDSSPCLNAGRRSTLDASGNGIGRTTMGAWQPWASPKPNRRRSRYSGDSIFN